MDGLIVEKNGMLFIKEPSSTGKWMMTYATNVEARLYPQLKNTRCQYIYGGLWNLQTGGSIRSELRPCESEEVKRG